VFRAKFAAVENKGCDGSQQKLFAKYAKIRKVLAGETNESADTF
jgi:hypothetical protein